MDNKKLKEVSCAFFRHWWNEKGNNTEEGFDKWFNGIGKYLVHDDSEVDITKPLRLYRLDIDPIDEDGDFIIESSYSRRDEFFTYISMEEAKQVINYLTNSINEQQT